MLYIFDKDNCIISRIEERPVSIIEQQQLLPGVAQKCARLRTQGHSLAVASNQGGVAFGIISEAEAADLVAHAASLIQADAWAMCPHHPGGSIPAYAIECNCRKPAPGMLLDLMARLGYKARDVAFVGDQESDQKAAQAAGVRFAWAADFFSGNSYAKIMRFIEAGLSQSETARLLGVRRQNINSILKYGPKQRSPQKKAEFSEALMANVLECIQEFWLKNYYSPSVREIAEAVNASSSTTQKILIALEHRGDIQRSPGVARSIVIKR